jgi:hypothetical protein
MNIFIKTEKAKRWLKPTALFLIVGVMLAFLNSCAIFPVSPQRERVCSKSPVIYTNLLSPQQKRIYETPDGIDCSHYYRGKSYYGF